MAFHSPLTTAFTPPASCTTDYYLSPGSGYYIGDVIDTSKCLPSGPKPSLNNAYYSPGLYCPAGYTVACSSTLTNDNVAETGAVCCPSFTGTRMAPNMTDKPFSCQSEATQFPWYQSMGCTLTFSEFYTVTYTVISDGTVGNVVTTTDGPLGVNAYSVQIRWQASDLDSARAASSSSVRAAEESSSKVAAAVWSKTAHVSRTPTNDSPALSMNSGGSGGLSTSAKIAIAVVVPVVALALLAGAFFFLRNYRRRHGVAGARNYPTDEYSDRKSELPAAMNQSSNMMHAQHQHFPTHDPSYYHSHHPPQHTSPESSRNPSNYPSQPPYYGSGQVLELI